MKTRSNLMRRMMLATLPLLVSILACSTLSPATPTPVPTDTPTFTPSVTPTNTATATSTPKPTNTATPNYQATQIAQREQAARDVLTQLTLPTDSGKLAWYQTEEVAINLEGPDGHYIKMTEVPTAGDFVLATEMTWKTDSWPICGFFFRADNRWAKGDYYLAQFLRFSGLPAWDFEYHKDGRWVNNLTVNTRFSDYLKLDSGSKNEIVVAAIGNQFKMWINGNFEGRYYDDSKRLSEGGLAFLGIQDAGKTTCAFNNSWIWLYK